MWLKAQVTYDDFGRTEQIAEATSLDPVVTQPTLSSTQATSTYTFWGSAMIHPKRTSIVRVRDSKTDLTASISTG